MRTVWEILLEMDKFKYQAGEQDQGEIWSWTWRSFRAGESCSGVGVGNAFSISQADFAGAVRVLRAPATCSV